MAERGHGADAPLTGDRAARGSAADLLRRLEGLPHGHPSSPYHDDGSAKPALTRLKDLELPLPPGGTSTATATPPAPVPVPSPVPAPAWEPDADDSPGSPDPASEFLADEAPADEAPVYAEAAAPEVVESGVIESGVIEPEAVDLEAAGPGVDAPETAGLETGAPGPAAPEPLPGGASPNGSALFSHDRDGAPNGRTMNGATDDGITHPAVPDGSAMDGEVAFEPGERLTPDQVRIAVRAHGRCRLAEGRSVFGSYGEGGLTPAMRRVEDLLEHGELVPETERYALKSLDRFQQKLAKLIAEEPGASPDGLAAQVHDGIRYTFLYEPDLYTRGVQATRSTLNAHGYELQLLRNRWESGEYKGINSRWRDPVSGSHFEIQFHTQQSWDARLQAHDAYDQIASPFTPAPEKERLRARQRDIYSAVYPPPGSTGIADYRREG